MCVCVCVCVCVCMCVCVHVCNECTTDNSDMFPMQHVDPIVARSFAQLAAVAVKKHALESDPLLVSEEAN